MLKGLKSLKVSSSSLTDPEYSPSWVTLTDPLICAFLQPFVCLASAKLKNHPVVTSSGRAVNITRKEKDYCGMLEYKEGEESRLLKALVTGRFNQPMTL